MLRPVPLPAEDWNRALFKGIYVSDGQITRFD